MSSSRINAVLAEHKSESTARINAATSILSGAMAGILETAILYPFDTIGKRLQKNVGRVYQPGTSYSAALSKALFNNTTTANNFFDNWMSLYSGMPWGFTYKTVQRAYKLGCQPLVQGYLEEHHAVLFQDVFQQHSQSAMHAAAGGMLGLGEVFLLPIDAMKIKYQTNKAAYQGVNVLEIIKAENVFKGIGVTMLRNFVGSSVLFGTPYAIKEFFFTAKLKQPHDLALNLVSSAFSIFATSPFDVVKTRIQAEKESGSALKTAVNMLQTEGLFAFFKGALAKTAMQGPKLAFALTVAQEFQKHLTDEVEKTSTSLKNKV